MERRLWSVFVATLSVCGGGAADSVDFVQDSSRRSLRAGSQSARALQGGAAPVCSAWQLTIAAENIDWEAHIFEVQLYSGDVLISGPGKGIAISDCNASSPDFAFDGNASTKWVTCAGSSKVGKGIQYWLKQPNGVTKVTTKQWSDARNAIPKFGLSCSKGGEFTFVWTADLGTGQGDKTAVSGLAPPSPEDLAAYSTTTTTTMAATTTTTTVGEEFLRKPRIFVSRASYNLGSGGIANADQFCSQEARQAAKALLADEDGCGGQPCRRASTGAWPPADGRVDWPLLPNTTYYTEDLSRVVGTTSCHGFFTLFEAPVSSTCLNVPTGMNPDWSTQRNATCRSYKSSSSGDKISVGWVCGDSLTYKDLVGGTGTMSCSTSMKLLCVTTPDPRYVPAPSCQAPTFRVREISQYRPFILPQADRVVAYEGLRVALVIADSIRNEFDPDMNDKASNTAMELIVGNLQRMLELYDSVVGRTPRHFTGDARLEGRVPIEVGTIPAAGLANAAVAGAAVGPAFMKGMFDQALAGKNMIDHIFFYETMRNYMFPDVFTKVLDYATADGPLSTGWVNQGFVNIMGCLVLEKLDPPVSFTYFGKDGAAFRDMMEKHLNTYIGGSAYNVNNTFLAARLPWEPTVSLDNLVSGLLSFLYRKCGGVEFLARFFRALPDLLARAPPSTQNHTVALENFYIAASVGATGDLRDFFRTDLKWQLGESALNFVAARGLQPLAISEVPPEAPVAPQCPVWQLRIAAENRDWEAHVFEIELYSGDVLVSGPGKGNATSDCGTAAGNAFDGNNATKWVTCSGTKVGRNITYSLNSSSAITKIRTIQWSDANNAIPKFDVICVRGTNQTLVWTADLGTGAGVQVAVSQFVPVAPTSTTRTTSVPTASTTKPVTITTTVVTTKPITGVTTTKPTMTVTTTKAVATVTTTKPLTTVATTNPIVTGTTTKPLTTQPIVTGTTTQPTMSVTTTKATAIVTTTRPLTTVATTKPIVVTGATTSPFTTVATTKPLTTVATTKPIVVTGATTSPFTTVATTKPIVSVTTTKPPITVATTQPIVTSTTTKPVTTVATTNPILTATTTKPIVTATTTKAIVTVTTTKPIVTGTTTKPTGTVTTTKMIGTVTTTKPPTTVATTKPIGTVTTAKPLTTAAR